MSQQLGDLLRAARHRKGLSLREVGELTGIGYAHLCDMENGNHVNPTVRTIDRLSRLYRISVQRIVKASLASIADREPQGGNA